MIADHDGRSSAVDRAFHLSVRGSLHGEGKIRMNFARVAAAAGIEGGSDLRRQIDGDSAPDSFKVTVTLGLAGDFGPYGAAGGLGLHGIAGFDFNAAARGVGLDVSTHFFDAVASARVPGLDIAIHIAA